MDKRERNERKTVYGGREQDRTDEKQRLNRWTSQEAADWDDPVNLWSASKREGTERAERK